MKLLQKTIRGYLTYSAFILMIAIPAFYITIQSILVHEIDEELFVSKAAVTPKILKEFNAHNGENIHFLDDHLSIVPAVGNHRADSLFTIKIYDSISEEVIPFRVIQSAIEINGQPYLFTRRISLLENDDLIKTVLIVQIILLLLLLTGLFIINRNLSIKIWKPFYTTLEKLRNYKVERGPLPALEKSPVSEFQDLNQSLETLADRTQRAYISQKEFTENASHEMQTPLAIFQSKLELLMQTTPLNEEQAGLIDELADAGERMQRLNKSLVLLTKIENNQFPEVEKIAISEITDRYLSQYSPQINEKHLSVSFIKKDGTFTLANRMLIEILIGNLIGNAIRHNHQDGKIKIELNEGIFVIRNTGKTGSLDKNKLFLRFQKESSDSNSIGLGLAISNRIAALYNHTIAYSYTNDQHCFTLQFSQNI